MAAHNFKLAQKKDLDFIYSKMAELPGIFPHIRKDYVQRMINTDNVILERGVVIIFQKYQRKVKLGNTYAPKGAYIIHQILNTKLKSGAAHRIISKFCEDRLVVLTVRKANKRAVEFYKKNGFKKFGSIDWKNGEVPGIVMCSDNRKNLWHSSQRK